MDINFELIENKKLISVMYLRTIVKVIVSVLIILYGDKIIPNKVTTSSV